MGKGTGKGEGCCGSDAKILGEGDKRRCTDIGFLLLFLVMCGGIVYVTDWCFANGNPYLLIHGADSWGNVCGRDNRDITVLADCDNCALDLSDRPHQFYTTVGFETEKQTVGGITINVPSATDGLQEVMIICAKRCPDMDVNCKGSLENQTYCQDVLGVCLSSSKGLMPPATEYTVPYDDPNNPDKGFLSPFTGNYTGCPDSVSQTDEARYIKRCIPETWGAGIETAGEVWSYVETINEEFANDFFKTYIGQIYDSFYASWRECLACFAIALVTAYLIIVIMRCVVAPVVWFLIVGGILMSAALTWFLYERYQYVTNQIDEQRAANIPISKSEEREQDFYYYSGILMMVFTIIITLVVIALRNDIRIAIKVYEEASRALRKMPTVFITPLTTWIVMIGFFCCWLFAMCFLITSDSVYPVYINGSEHFYGHVKYLPKDEYDYFFWFGFFALFWTTQFFLAIQQMIIAGSVVKYYTTGGAPKNGAFCRSVWNVVRYHLGTAAFGSLIIAIIQMIRLVFEYVMRKMEGSTSLQKFLKRCISCCLWCLEKCMKFINKNAYIETMLCGLDFCNGASRAFMVILKNILKIGALSFVGTIVVFMVKLITACLVAFIAFQWLKDRPEIPILGVVVFFLFLVGWWIGDAFASVYEMVADTLLICFCEDKAQGGEPKGPSTLTNMINKHAGTKDKEVGGERRTSNVVG